MHKVEVGQVWIVSWPRGRVRLVVTGVADDVVTMRMPGQEDRPYKMRRGTLERGLRAARLLLHPDGMPAPDPGRRRQDRRKPSPRALKALELQKGGMKRDMIAERFGVPKSSIDRWLSTARIAERREGAST